MIFQLISTIVFICILSVLRHTKYNEYVDESYARYIKINVLLVILLGIFVLMFPKTCLVLEIIAIPITYFVWYKCKFLTICLRPEKTIINNITRTITKIITYSD